MSEKMSENTNALNWFEIPAKDIKRAAAFYEAIFDVKLFQMEMGDTKMAMFPSDSKSGKSGGALAESPMHNPGKVGALVYLNGNPDLQVVLDRIESAGGKINMPKMGIGENGFMAVFEDSEGNALGLHSNN